MVDAEALSALVRVLHHAASARSAWRPRSPATRRARPGRERVRPSSPRAPGERHDILDLREVRRRRARGVLGAPRASCASSSASGSDESAPIRRASSAHSSARSPQAHRREGPPRPGWCRSTQRERGVRRPLGDALGCASRSSRPGGASRRGAALPAQHGGEACHHRRDGLRRSHRRRRPACPRRSHARVGRCDQMRHRRARLRQAATHAPAASSGWSAAIRGRASGSTARGLPDVAGDDVDQCLGPRHLVLMLGAEPGLPGAIEDLRARAVRARPTSSARAASRSRRWRAPGQASAPPRATEGTRRRTHRLAAAPVRRRPPTRMRRSRQVRRLRRRGATHVGPRRSASSAAASTACAAPIGHGGRVVHDRPHHGWRKATVGTNATSPLASTFVSASSHDSPPTASAERARQRGGLSAAALLLWRAAELTPDRERASERLLEAARADLVGRARAAAREILDRARASGLALQHARSSGMDRGADPHRRRRTSEQPRRCWPALSRGSGPATPRSATGACVAADAWRSPLDTSSKGRTPHGSPRVRGTSPYR